MRALWSDRQSCSHNVSPMFTYQAPFLGGFKRENNSSKETLGKWPVIGNQPIEERNCPSLRAQRLTSEIQHVKRAARQTPYFWWEF